MFKSLFKYSLRSFKRQRSYIVINVFGLTIGIACSLFIAFFILNELSYDRFNTKHNRIFRVIQHNNYDGQDFTAAFTPAVLGPATSKEIPEIESFLRMFRHPATEIEYNDQTYTEDHLVEVDSSFFNFFSISLKKGVERNLLNAPRKIVLSESTAKKIFGNEDPIDKILKIGSDSIGYTVTGVMADIPENSHFEANIILSFMSNPQSNDQIWTTNSFSTYLLLKNKTNYLNVDQKMSEIVNKYVGAEIQQQMGITMNEWTARGHKYGYYLQKLKDIHLDHSINMQEFKDSGDPKYLRILASLAILIILIASINFMNLATAQASRRAREVGIKKIGGSSKWMLIIQFLSESYILSFISLVLAMILLRMTLPYLNNLIGANLNFSLFKNWYTLPFLILFTLLVGLISGGYPALVLSSFSPYEVLKGKVRSSMQNGLVRRILVVFQFTVSILLIIGTIIMYRQIKYMLNKDLGFSKEQIIVINKSEALGKKMMSFKESIRGIPGVINTVSSTAVPGHNNNSVRYKLGNGKDITVVIETNHVDYDYLNTYGIQLLSGRTFDKSITSDRNSCLINESAVKDFGITDIETTRFLNAGDSRKYLQVIGVVRNFHFKSLHSQISPYLFRLNTDDYPGSYLSVKLSALDYTKTIRAIETKWKEFTGNKSFNYYFVDDDFERLYVADKQNARISMIFSILAVFIAALGLFGLTSFTIEQRTKEIGVRKAMGSSITGIYFEISKEVIMLVSGSALIAIPLIYIIAAKWLESFYYRINPGIFTFLAGFSIALGVALLTISYRIMRAARVNPAESLKYE
jgi:putative ABC transport system permease protein